MVVNYEFQHNEISNFYILIDSCSMLCRGATAFWDTRIKWYKQHPSYANKIKIPMACIEETSKRDDNPNLSEREKKEINKMKKTLAKAQEADACVAIKDHGDNLFADHTIFFHIAELLMKNDILLITQDKGLTQSLYNLKNRSIIPAIKYKKNLCICKIDDDGALSEAIYKYKDVPLHYKKISYKWSENLFKENTNNENTNNQTPSKNKKEEEKPQLKTLKNDTKKTTPKNNTKTNAKSSSKNNQKKNPSSKGNTKFPDSLSWGRRFLETGTKVILYSSKKKITLGKSLGSGKEGEVFLINEVPEKVVKIYKPTGKPKTIETTYKKLVSIISKNLEYPGICFPEDIIVDESNNFLGYIMDKAEGKPLAVAAIGKRNEKYNKRHLIRWCQKILEKIDYLHSHKMIMGDLNVNNILLNLEEETIYFVDVDSYQVDNYLCPTYTDNFLAPYLTKESIAKNKRTVLDDNYAVSVLMFYLLMQGKFPYIQSNTDKEYLQLKIEGAFPYPFGEISQKNAPSGEARYIWSFFTKSMKKEFWNTFSEGGTYFKSHQYITPKRWIELLNNYSSTLSNKGSLNHFDKMSLDIHPKRLKFSAKEEYGTPCPKCHQKFPRKDYIKGYCINCARTELIPQYSGRCKSCGKKISFTIYDAYGPEKKPVPSGLCPTCLRLRKQK